MGERAFLPQKRLAGTVKARGDKHREYKDGVDLDKAILTPTLNNYISRLLDKLPVRAVKRVMIRRRGDFREMEAHGLVPRANYAYGILRAADLARFLGKSRATVCEFGVATGNGLLNMVELAELVRARTGVEIRVVGLDTGEGLPAIDGYKDHPEIWSAGDFTMTNKEDLRQRVMGRAELIFGDIKDTVGDFVASLDGSAPLGFISVDVDIYSGAKSALSSLAGKAELYAPAVSIYCDDVRFFFANRWCGELRAIAEFNDENPLRKIDRDRSLPGHRPSLNEGWYSSMFVCHVLDHEVRTSPRQRSGLSLQEHYEFMKHFSLF